MGQPAHAPHPHPLSRRERGGESLYRAGLRIALIWTGAAFSIATQRYLRGPSLEPRLALSWGGALAASGVTAFLWALLTPACLRAARRWRPRRGAFLRNLAALVAAGSATSLLHLL